METVAIHTVAIGSDHAGYALKTAIADFLRDSGYEVTVTKASIISYRLQLVECDLSSSFSNYLRAFGGSQLAYAGHGDDTNLTTVDGPFVESLDSPANVEVVGLLPGNQAFCQLHYLVSGKGSDIEKKVKKTYRFNPGKF